MHGVSDLDGVAVRLPVDAEQHRRLAVGADHRVDRRHRGRHFADVADVHRRVVGTLDDDAAEVVEAVHLSTDEAEEQLVVASEQAGRVDRVRAVHEESD